MHPTRIFKTPEELYEAFIAYKAKRILEAHNWPKVQYVGKDGDRREDYPVLPLTLDGFEIFCYDNHGCVEQYFKNKDELYTDFVPICSRVRKEIKDNQITGGMLGNFNPSITQRLNGLKELTETEHKGGLTIPVVPDIGTRK